MNEIISSVTPIIETYGILGVFFLSIVEEIIAPIPSSLVLMGAGFFLIPSGGFIDVAIGRVLLKIVLPASFGLTIGSLLVYSFAKLGGEALVMQLGRHFGITSQKLEAVGKRFRGGSFDELVLIGFRAIPVIPNILVSLGCGILRYPVRQFITMSFIGNSLRAFLMALLGWSLGEAYAFYVTKFSEVGNVILFISLGLIFAIFTALFVRKKMHRKSLKIE